MGRAEEYREKALQAERDATQISRTDERKAMLEIARTWRELAEDEERAAPRDGAQADKSRPRE